MTLYLFLDTMLENLKNMVVEKGSASKVTVKPNGVIVETVEQLPDRYNREAISMEEILYIEVCSSQS